MRVEHAIIEADRSGCHRNERRSTERRSGERRRFQVTTFHPIAVGGGGSFDPATGIRAAARAYTHPAGVFVPIFGGGRTDGDACSIARPLEPTEGDRRSRDG